VALLRAGRAAPLQVSGGVLRALCYLEGGMAPELCRDIAALQRVPEVSAWCVV
jgi:hypothetical protein